jgi:hypothetical protein
LIINKDLVMSRPYYPVLNAQGQQGNFGVVSRVNRIDYVDYPQRTQAIGPVVIPLNLTGTVPTQILPSQVQNNTIIISATGASGSAGSTFILPTAQSLLEAFSGMAVGRSIRLNVVNKGNQTASIFANPSNGQVTLAQFPQFFGLTGGATGAPGVVPYFAGVNVAPVGTTVFGASLTGSYLVGPFGGLTLGSRSIDIEFVSISPNPLNTPLTQFVANGSTGAYIVY